MSPLASASIFALLTTRFNSFLFSLFLVYNLPCSHSSKPFLFSNTATLFSSLHHAHFDTASLDDSPSSSAFPKSCPLIQTNLIVRYRCYFHSILKGSVFTSSSSLFASRQVEAQVETEKDKMFSHRSVSFQELSNFARHWPVNVAYLSFVSFPRDVSSLSILKLLTLNPILIISICSCLQTFHLHPRCLPCQDFTPAMTIHVRSTPSPGARIRSKRKLQMVPFRCTTT